MRDPWGAAAGGSTARSEPASQPASEGRRSPRRVRRRGAMPGARRPNVQIPAIQAIRQMLDGNRVSCAAWDDSPWYPSARMFRQAQPGRRDDVIERTAHVLETNHGTAT